jgi:hypothetical protein
VGGMRRSERGGEESISEIGVQGVNYGKDDLLVEHVNALDNAERGCEGY